MDHRFIKTVATDVQGMPTQTGGINGGPVARPEGFNDRARGNYVNVDSLDASVARATSLGATPMKGRTAVPGMGWLAMLSDPDGNTLAMWQQDSAAK